MPAPSDPRLKHLISSALLLSQTSAASTSTAYLLFERREFLAATNADSNPGSKPSSNNTGNAIRNAVIVRAPTPPSKPKDNLILPHCGACGTVLVPGVTAKNTIIPIDTRRDVRREGKGRPRRCGQRNAAADEQSNSGPSAEVMRQGQHASKYDKVPQRYSRPQQPKQLRIECLSCHRTTTTALPRKSAHRPKPRSHFSSSLAKTDAFALDPTIIATTAGMRHTSANPAQIPNTQGNGATSPATRSESQPQPQSTARKRRKGRGATALLDRLKLDEEERERRKAEDGMDLMDFLKAG